MNTYCISTLDKATADRIASIFLEEETYIEDWRTPKDGENEPEKASIYDLTQNNPCVVYIWIDTELSRDDFELKLKDTLCYFAESDRLFGKNSDILEAFLDADRDEIISELEAIQDSIEDCFTDDEGNIGVDIRLCCDRDDENGHYTCNIRSGNAQYDTEHSNICVPRFVTPTSDLTVLADDLISEASNNAGMME